MIDTHSHIYLEEFDPDRAEVVARAALAGIRHLVLPNVDCQTIARLYATHDCWPEYTSMAMGLHPTSVDDNWRESLDTVSREFGRRSFVAIGEVGIDLYWDKTFRLQQMDVFEAQLHWAEELRLPVIIHCRDGLDTVLDVFGRYVGSLPQCVFHSFGGTADDVARLRCYGDFYFGINGIVTFKNSRLADVLPAIGIDRILLETDCPYLAPVPKRGKRNESCYIPYIAGKIADTLGLTPAQVSAATDRNAITLFGLCV